LLKGLFDTYSEKLDIIVTGSAQLDVYRHGGDSLMGRCFPYRMHPLSVAELLSPKGPFDAAIQPPSEIAQDDFDRLQRMGGFPEPYERNDHKFYNRWRRLRSQLLFQEDLRELTRIRELGQVETLSLFVADRVGATVNYSSFARDIGASVNTIKSWLETLERLYYCFSVRSWHKNVTRAFPRTDRSEACLSGCHGCALRRPRLFFDGDSHHRAGPDVPIAACLKMPGRAADASAND
jgi:hypothetical protein